jgi:hypothetical protein
MRAICHVPGVTTSCAVLFSRLPVRLCDICAVWHHRIAACFLRCMPIAPAPGTAALQLSYAAQAQPAADTTACSMSMAAACMNWAL